VIVTFSPPDAAGDVAVAASVVGFVSVVAVDSVPLEADVLAAVDVACEAPPQEASNRLIASRMLKTKRDLCFINFIPLFKCLLVYLQ
jgi:hypothetical protein